MHLVPLAENKKRLWAECCDRAAGALQEAAGMWNADTPSLAGYSDAASPLRRRRTALAATEIEGASAVSPLGTSQPRSIWHYAWRYMKMKQHMAKMDAIALEDPTVEEVD